MVTHEMICWYKRQSEETVIDFCDLRGINTAGKTRTQLICALIEDDREQLTMASKPRNRATADDCVRQHDSVLKPSQRKKSLQQMKQIEGDDHKLNRTQIQHGNATSPPSASKTTRARPTSVETLKCFVCNQGGHYSSLCPKMMRPSPPVSVKSAPPTVLLVGENGGGRADSLQLVTASNSVTVGLRGMGSEDVLALPGLRSCEDVIPGEAMVVTGGGGAIPALSMACVSLNRESESQVGRADPPNVGGQADNLQPVTASNSVTVGLRGMGSEDVLALPGLRSCEDVIPGEAMVVTGGGGAIPAVPMACVSLNWKSESQVGRADSTNGGGRADSLQLVTVGNNVSVGLRDTGSMDVLALSETRSREDVDPKKSTVVTGGEGDIPVLPTAFVALPQGSKSKAREVGIADATNVPSGTDLGRLVAHYESNSAPRKPASPPEAPDSRKVLLGDSVHVGNSGEGQGANDCVPGPGPSGLLKPGPREEAKVIINSETDNVLCDVNCHDLCRADLPSAAVVTPGAHRSAPNWSLPTATEELSVEGPDPTGSDPCELGQAGLRSPQAVVSLASVADSSESPEAVKIDISLEEYRGLADGLPAGDGEMRVYGEQNCDSVIICKEKECFEVPAKMANCVSAAPRKDKQGVPVILCEAQFSAVCSSVMTATSNSTVDSGLCITEEGPQGEEANLTQSDSTPLTVAADSTEFLEADTFDAGPEELRRCANRRPAEDKVEVCDMGQRTTPGGIQSSVTFSSVTVAASTAIADSLLCVAEGSQPGDGANLAPSGPTTSAAAADITEYFLADKFDVGPEELRCYAGRPSAEEDRVGGCDTGQRMTRVRIKSSVSLSSVPTATSIMIEDSLLCTAGERPQDDGGKLTPSESALSEAVAGRAVSLQADSFGVCLEELRDCAGRPSVEAERAEVWETGQRVEALVPRPWNQVQTTQGRPYARLKHLGVVANRIPPDDQSQWLGMMIAHNDKFACTLSVSSQWPVDEADPQGDLLANPDPDPLGSLREGCGSPLLSARGQAEMCQVSVGGTFNPNLRNLPCRRVS